MTDIATRPGNAIVTGAASGLGRAVSRLLVSRGWQVGGIDIQSCPDLGLAVLADVSDPESADEAVTTLASELGVLDSLAHCAGVFPAPMVPLHMTSNAEWDSALQVNLNGSFYIARSCLRYMHDRGGGSIVLTSSVSADAPQPGSAGYSVSKAGVLALTRAIALEYAASGIRCNAVLPGYMRTAMNEKLLAREDRLQVVENSIPMHRVADPDEVAEVVAFLMSAASGYVTGEGVTADGGAALTAFVHAGDTERLWRHR
jgi:NAD(P)-dependent dehydrogenase (short-subunit alcohol dehydrogenase family)